MPEICTSTTVHCKKDVFLGDVCPIEDRRRGVLRDSRLMAGSSQAGVNTFCAFTTSTGAVAGRRCIYSRGRQTSPPKRGRHFSAQSCRCALPLQLRELTQRIAEAHDEKSRYMKLVEIGDAIDALPPAECKHANRVAGCTAVAHIDVRVCEQSLVHLRGTADARVSRGLIALLVCGLQGAIVDDVVNITAGEISRAAGLSTVVGPSRTTGLASALAHVQKRVREAMGSGGDGTKNSQHAERQQVRWTARQGEDVAVLLSGGVDSSVAMRLVMERGMRPHAFYLKIWLDDELSHLGQCPWEEDMRYAKSVCEQAGVSLDDIPLQTEYWERVVAYTIAEARRGRTPNPDVMCNTRIKFGAFYDKIGKNFEKVVSGHYARCNVNSENGFAQLRMSNDALKDQTYFLANLCQEQLKRCIFPLGDSRKAQVRQLAQKYNLPNQDRRDSQGICFLGKLRFDEFLEYHLGIEVGAIVEYESGVTLGTHKGLWFYTLGQRKRIGLSGGPWYVVSKDATRNIVYVSRNYDDDTKSRDSFEFEDANWISQKWPNDMRIGESLDIHVKVRHGPNFAEGIITRTGELCGNVKLRTRDKGLAPGQFAVFYQKDLCLGSAKICSDLGLHRAPALAGKATMRYS